MRDKVEETEKFEEMLEFKWPYGLSDIESIEGTEVTDEHRRDAMFATGCECLHYMEVAVHELSPGFRRYGGTLAKIVTQFQEARSTIKEEMTRIAHRNLRCVVTGNLGGRRVMSARLATHEKEMRDGARERLKEARDDVNPMIDDNVTLGIDLGKDEGSDTVAVVVDLTAGTVDEVELDETPDDLKTDPI